MDNKTEDNHFVPQGYLKNFIKNNHIYYKDILNNYPVQKTQSVKGLCVEENLYTLHEKISNEEFQQFLNIACINDKFLIDLCEKIKNYLNGDFSEMGYELNSLIKVIASFYMDNKETCSYYQEDLYGYYDNLFPNICENIIEIEQIPTFEDDKYAIDDLMYNLQVCCARKALNCLYNGILEDTQDEVEKEDLKSKKRELFKQMTFEQNDYMNIILYMAIQFFRTDNTIKKLASIIKDEHFKEKFAFLYAQCMPYVIVSNIVQKNGRLRLIINSSSTDFITSDNPCINIADTNELNLYMPISNKLAIICNNIDNNDKNIATDSEISSYNKLLKNKATKYIIGCSEDILNNI